MTYIIFCRHGAREEEVGDGGEKQAAGGDEQAHPPGPDPTGVTVPQLMLGSCRKHVTVSRLRPLFTARKTTFGKNFKRSQPYLSRFCPHPRRSAAPLSPAGSQWQARTQIPQTGWLRTMKQLWGRASEALMSCYKQGLVWVCFRFQALTAPTCKKLISNSVLRFLLQETKQCCSSRTTVTLIIQHKNTPAVSQIGTI